jgi:hypothetical protein
LPVFYLLLSFWIRSFGISEIALRVLTGLFYLAGGIASYFLGRTVFQDGRVALYSSFCYLISGQAIRQSQNVRMYSLLGLLAATSTLLFFRLAKRPTTKDWVLYVLLTAVGTLTHVWFFFVVFSQMICLLILPKPGRYKFVFATLLAFVPFIILWLPTFFAQIQNGATAWMPRFQFLFVLSVFVEFYRAHFSFRLERLPISLELGLLFYGGCAALTLPRALIRSERRSPDRYVLLLVYLLTASIATPLIVSIFKPIYWPGRYTIIALPAFALLLGWALAKFSPWRLSVCFCYAMLLATTAYRIKTREEVPELRGTPDGYTDKRTAQYILQHAQSSDVLVFTDLSRAAIDYYLLRNDAANRFREVNFPAEIANHLGWEDPRAMLEDPHRIQTEAELVATNLQALLSDGRNRIWLFWGGASEIDQVLWHELDLRFAIEQEVDLRGSYYQRVLVLAIPTKNESRSLLRSQTLQ